MELITNSSAGAYRACPRLYSIRYEQGYRPRESASTLRFGTLAHNALEAWWLEPVDRLGAALASIESADADPFDVAKARVMLTGYNARWSDEPLEVVGVEVEFATALLNPTTGRGSRTFGLAGKMDALARDTDGKLWIVEHKTSSENIGAGSEYWRRLQLDPQVSTYYEGARSLGHDPAGVLYDVLGKPAIRPAMATPVEARKYTKATKDKPSALYANQRTDDELPDDYEARLLAHVSEQPDRYYQRGIVVRTQDDELDAAHDRWQVAAAIRESRRSGRWPRYPGSCVRYGRTCEFFDVCTRVASLDDPLRFERTERVHSELTTAIQQTEQETASCKTQAA